MTSVRDNNASAYKLKLNFDVISFLRQESWRNFADKQEQEIVNVSRISFDFIC